MPLSGAVGGVELVVLITKYPEGFPDAPVNEPETEDAVVDNERSVGCAVGVVQRGGGVKAKVSPEEGKIDEEKVHEALLAVPAVVAPQFVVVVLLLKSEFKVPPRPTCAMPEVEFAVKLP